LGFLPGMAMAIMMAGILPFLPFFIRCPPQA
jgi:hypothetical protein